MVAVFTELVPNHTDAERHHRFKRAKPINFKSSSPTSITSSSDQIDHNQQQYHQHKSLFQLPPPSTLLRYTVRPAPGGDTHQLVNNTNQDDSHSTWVISIKGKLDQARQDDLLSSSWGKLCIYRIPASLRISGDIKAYVPHLVSLGPYHRGRLSLQEMDRHKWRALHHVIKRTRHDITIYLNAMLDLEDRARAYYEGPLTTHHLSSHDFADMMLLDCNFVLEIFRGTAEGFTRIGYARNDPVFSMRGTMHSIRRDMAMLENQIPLFVLYRLLPLQLARTPEQKGASLVAKLALLFLDPLMPTDEPLTDTDRAKLQLWIGADQFDPLSDHAVGLHCLDVVRPVYFEWGPNPPH